MLILPNRKQNEFWQLRWHAARDAYAEAADNLKKVNAKFGIV